MLCVVSLKETLISGCCSSQKSVECLTCVCVFLWWSVKKKKQLNYNWISVRLEIWWISCVVLFSFIILVQNIVFSGKWWLSLFFFKERVFRKLWGSFTEGLLPTVKDNPHLSHTRKHALFLTLSSLFHTPLHLSLKNLLSPSFGGKLNSLVKEKLFGSFELKSLQIYTTCRHTHTHTHHFHWSQALEV